MTTRLPGSSSGKTLGLSAMKAGLRLVGGADLADAIADLTGLSARRIKGLARESRQLVEDEQIEFRDVAHTFYPVAEAAVVKAFRRAAERDQQAIPVAALTGAGELLDHLNDEALRSEMRQWSQDEAAYAGHLLRELAQLCRKWYLEDGTARAYATAAGVGHILRENKEALSILRQHSGATRPPQMDAAVGALEKQIASLGWEWTPARAGQLGCLDGFMTPTDETGALLPLQIPVRLMRCRSLEVSRDKLLGPHVAREDADLLRAHVPSGYFMIYCEEDHSLYFANAENVAERLARNKKLRARVTLLRADLVTGAKLEAIGREAGEVRARLLGALANPVAGEPARRLYQTLSSAHHVLFEFIATLAFAAPANLWAIYQEWWPDLADDRGPDNHRSELMSTISEYWVEPPTGLLQGQGPSLLLSVMRSTIDNLDEIDLIFRAYSGGVSENLGIPGLRNTIAAAIERCYRTVDGLPIPVNTPESERPSWIVVRYGHYFMSVALVALVVDRLMMAVQEILLPPVKGSIIAAPHPIWIRHSAGPGV